MKFYLILLTLCSVSATLALAQENRSTAVSKSERKPRLTSEAKKLFKDYLSGQPERLARERRCSKVDPLADPAAYFRIELREPEHAPVKQGIEQNGGVLTAELMKKWIEENSAENPNSNCDVD